MLRIIYKYSINITWMSKWKINITELHYKWRLPSLSELTPMIFNTELTHLARMAPYIIFKHKNKIQ